MSKKESSKIYIIAGIVIIVVIAYLFLNGNTNYNNYNTMVLPLSNFKNTFQLSLTPSSIMTCTTKNSLYFTDSNGVIHLTSDVTKLFVPNLDVTTNGQKLKSISGNLLLSCSFNSNIGTPPNNINLLGDTAIVTISGTDKNNVNHVISTQSFPVSPANANAGTFGIVKLAEWGITAEQIQNQLGVCIPANSNLQDTTSKNCYSFITVTYSYKLRFTNYSQANAIVWQYDNTNGGANSPPQDTNVIRINFAQNLVTNTPAQSNIMILKWLNGNTATPSDHVVDLAMSNRYFTVQADLPDWTIDEGYPTIFLINQFDGKTYAQWQLTNPTKSDVYSVFTLTATVSPDTTPYGEYKLLLKSGIDKTTGQPKRTDNSNNSVFLVLKAPTSAIPPNSPPNTPPPVPCDTQTSHLDPVSGRCYANKINCPDGSIIDWTQSCPKLPSPSDNGSGGGGDNNNPVTTPSIYDIISWIQQNFLVFIIGLIILIVIIAVAKSGQPKYYPPRY